MGPPNERGFVNVVSADADIQGGLDRWLRASSRYRWAPPSFVINVTTAGNEIVASTGCNPLPRDWEQ